MPVGLEVYKSAGGPLLLGITTYVGMFHGVFSTGGSATGSFVDAAMIGRTLLTFLPDTGLYGGYGGPVVSLDSSTGTISWAYPTYSGSSPAIPSETVYYGGY